MEEDKLERRKAIVQNPDSFINEFKSIISEKFIGNFKEFKKIDTIGLSINQLKNYDGIHEHGVYMIFTSHSEELFYIGKASCPSSSILKRLLSHIDINTGNCYTKHKKETKKLVSYIAYQVIHKDYSFLASALEEFLIRKIGPYLNTIGILEKMRSFVSLEDLVDIHDDLETSINANFVDCVQVKEDFSIEIKKNINH